MTDHHSFNQVRLGNTIRIDHQAERRLACFRSDISRSAGESAPLEVNQPNRGELACDDLGSFIFRTVYDNDFIRNRGLLSQYRMQASSNCTLGVVAGNDYGYDRIYCRFVILVSHLSYKSFAKDRLS